jgi:hypothetical protein
MIWGISTEKETVYSNLPDFQCPKCSDIGEVNAMAYCKYLHIVFIPTFSIGKRSKFYCSSCESKIKKQFIPASLLPVAEELKDLVKIPITHFIGVSILGILIIAIAIIMATTPDKPSIEPTVALQSPQVNDIYSVYISEEENLYSTWKVINVDEDSIYIFKNQVEIEGIWDFTMGKDKESAQLFIPDTIGYSKAAILEMYNEEFITDVDRELVD